MIFSRQSSIIKMSLLPLILLFGLFIGQSMVSNNYINLFILLSPLLLFIVWQSNLGTLLIISIIIFFGDWFIALNFIPPQFMWIQELLAFLLFLKAVLNKTLKRKKFYFIGSWIMIVFLSISLLSYYVNNSGFISLILFLRLILRYYLLFLAVINTNLQEHEMKMFNIALLSLIVIQLPVALVKFYVYGQSERAIGTYAYHGGAASTILPLVVIGFTISYLLIYKNPYFLLLIIGYIMFSIVGGKRGFIFYLPLLLIFLVWFFKDKVRHIYRYATLGLCIFAVSLFFVLKFIPTLSPGRYERTGFHPLYALRWVYSEVELEMNGYSYGRLSSTDYVNRNLVKDGAVTVLFGKGPGFVMKTAFTGLDTRTRLTEEFRIKVGLSGLSWLIINVGYLGMIVYFGLLIFIMSLSIRHLKKEKDRYWRAFSLGVAVFSFVLIIINIGYSNVAKSDLFIMHYFCLSAFLVKRNRAIISDNLHSRSQIKNIE